ncbi:unnamed protein product [Closterium sp. NIES-54]
MRWARLFQHSSHCALHLHSPHHTHPRTHPHPLARDQNYSRHPSPVPHHPSSPLPPPPTACGPASAFGGRQTGRGAWRAGRAAAPVVQLKACGVVERLKDKDGYRVQHHRYMAHKGMQLGAQIRHENLVCVNEYGV